jgi:hypothetical protein
MTDESITVPSVPGVPGEPYYGTLLRTEVKSDDKLGEGERAESVVEREARKMDERLPGYRPESAAEMTFDPRLAYEVALGVDGADALFAKYGLAREQAVALLGSAAFIGTVKRYKEEFTTTGISFKLKAKIQAEDLLTHSYLMATDPEVPFPVRADLIKWTARVAGLEPKDKDGGGGAAAGFTLNISFSGDRPAEPRVIEGTVVEEGE